jgi:hypothetical protein
MGAFEDQMRGHGLDPADPPWDYLDHVELAVNAFPPDDPLEPCIRDYLAKRDGVFSPATVYREHATRRDDAPLDGDLAELRDTLARVVDAEVGNCYWNAQAALHTGFDVRYVEGVMAAADMRAPYYHAWLEAEGRVVDLTLGELVAPCYVGVEYPVAQVLDVVDSAGESVCMAEAVGPPP